MPIKNILLLVSIVLLLFNFGCSQSEALAPPKGYKSTTTMKVAYATGLLKLIESSPDVPDSITVHKDLVYKESPQKPLKLDIYHLNSINEATPLVVFIHGGSWKKGDKDDYRRYLVDYAAKGYVTATLSYRLSPIAPFPAAFDDVVCGIKWLRSNAAKYHIDPDRIAVVGGSAGGHLAMMLGYHGNDSTYVAECAIEADVNIKAIVNLYGPADLTTDFAINHPSVIQFVGQEYSEETKGAFDAVSPLQFISPDDPPTLTFHGTIDEIVPVEQSDRLHEELQQKNVVSYYHRLKGWPHTMDMGRKVNKYCQYYMDEFFEKHLK